ncbi:tetratricopeptide repeat protein [uncultured Bacteroides sp.]|uniref:tetratricopeptide repeat protein n=1 Tax=uncultured Bacteroides sp. TaxID=162156 RepID=UPI0025F351FA|nr:tetratricopeptide repeat protein [uncultured Bacteroides sp.]
MGIFSKIFRSNKKKDVTKSSSSNAADEVKVLNETLLATANQLYNNGQYERAFQLFKTISEGSSNVDAVFNLAMCYYRGIGTEKNVQEALKWFKNAAEQGDDQAMYNIAITYHDGKEVSRNMDEAKKWYMKAASKGNQRAIAELQKLE